MRVCSVDGAQPSVGTLLFWWKFTQSDICSAHPSQCRDLQVPTFPVAAAAAAPWLRKVINGYISGQTFVSLSGPGSALLEGMMRGNSSTRVAASSTKLAFPFDLCSGSLVGTDEPRQYFYFPHSRRNGKPLTDDFQSSSQPPTTTVAEPKSIRTVGIRKYADQKLV